jgi:hypothetical protein
MNELRPSYYALHSTDVLGYLISFQQKGSFISEKKTYRQSHISLNYKEDELPFQ